MNKTVKQALVRALGKRALVQTTNMLAQLAAKGFGDALTPIQRLKRNPGSDPAAYALHDDRTWPGDPKSGKGPILPGWATHVVNAEDIAQYDRDGNGAGIVCRADPADGKSVVGLDCDIPHREGSTLVLGAMRDALRALGRTHYFLRRRGGDPWLSPVLISDGAPDYERRFTKDGYSLELIGAGRQFVALGPHACGGWRYWSRFDLIDGKWVETPLDEMPARHELPDLTKAQAGQVYIAMARACGAKYASTAAARKDIKIAGWHRGAPSLHADGGGGSGQIAAHPLPAAQQKTLAAPSLNAVRLILAALPNQTDARDPWIGEMIVIIGALRGASEADARELSLDWCGKLFRSDPAEDERVFEDLWSQRERITVGYPDLLNMVKPALGGHQGLRGLGLTPEETLLRNVFGTEPDKPVVRFRAGALNDTIAEICDALVAVGAPIYAQGGRLVSPRAAGKTGEIQLVEVTADWMRLLVAEHVVIVKKRDREEEWRPVSLTLDTARLLLTPVAQDRFAPVRGLLEWPSLRPDSSLLGKPGYDAQTGYFLTRAVPGVAVPDAPSPAEASAALALVRGLLAEFPFTSPEGESAALAAMLHLAARPLMNVVPATVLVSPSPRTGKSYLTRLICAVALGREVASIAAHKDAAENDKALTGLLLAGTSIVNFDNADGRMSSPLMAQAIENPAVSLRALMTSKVVHIQNTWTVFINGNNIAVSGDLPARCLYVELDAQQEHPEHRLFKGNPLSDVLANQGKYLSALLTIVRWGMHPAAARPALTPLASFGQWSRLAREPLVMLGLPDPCATQAHLRANSDDLGGADAELFAIFADVTKGKPHSFAELRTVCLMGLSMDQSETVLASLADPKRPSEVGRNATAYWLRKNNGRIRGGIQLIGNTPSSKSKPALWRFAPPDVV